MKTEKAVAFLREPSTVLGLSALIGTFTAVLTGQLTWESAVPAIAGAIAAIVLPDNSHAQAAIKGAAAAVIIAEQAAVEQPVQASVAVGGVKATAMMVCLIVGSCGLSACAAQSKQEMRAATELRTPCAARAAGTASPGADSSVATEFGMLDGREAVALAVSRAVPDGDWRAQAGEMAAVALAIDSALRMAS